MELKGVMSKSLPALHWSAAYIYVPVLFLHHMKYITIYSPQTKYDAFLNLSYIYAQAVGLGSFWYFNENTENIMNSTNPCVSVF